MSNNGNTAVSMIVVQLNELVTQHERKLDETIYVVLDRNDAALRFTRLANLSFALSGILRGSLYYVLQQH